MGLPNSYIFSPNRIGEYFDAIINAQPPDRFSQKFLENLGFASTNDRLLIGVLKDLGFLNADSTPQPRYYQYLDSTQSQRVLAEAIREAYSDLFAVNNKANELSTEEARNKLRTLYSGAKTDLVISRIATTFTALCEIADFSASIPQQSKDKDNEQDSNVEESEEIVNRTLPTTRTKDERPQTGNLVRALQYHINIVLPDSRDPAVFDAIFKSLREHLG